MVDRNREDSFDNDTDSAVEKAGGAGTIAALIGVVYLALLVLMNTSRVDVNVVVYKFEDTPLWWFTVLVVVITLVADRLVRFALRRRRKKRD